MQKWFQYGVTNKKVRVSYDIDFKIQLETVEYNVKGTTVYENGNLKSLSIYEVRYKDELGEFTLDRYSKARFARIFRDNLIGNPDTGIFLNRPFRAIIKNFIPKEKEDL